MENNKVIWITGASSGIGRALAVKFAKMGWQVAASARRKNLLEELSSTYPNIYSFPLDVTNSNECSKVFLEIKEKMKNIQISFFCTGIHDPNSEKKLDLEKIRKIMEVNFFGTINSINSCINYFKEKKSGQICLVSSVAGYRGLPAAGAYCASKSAITSFAESLYFDLKRFNVKVTLVSPGFIKTPMTDQNDFPMPFIKSPEFAADKIYKGLVNGSSFEIDFPKELTISLKFLRILPYRLYLFLIDKFVKR